MYGLVSLTMRNYENSILLCHLRRTICLVLLLYSATGFSQAYMWKDTNGQIHFSDSPPPNSNDLKVKTLNIEEKNPAVNTDEEVRRRRLRQADLLRDFEASSRKREEKRAEKKRKKEERELRCQRAKNRAKHNQRYNLIYKEAPDGSRYYLNDDERKAYDKKLEDNVRKYCS